MTRTQISDDTRMDCRSISFPPASRREFILKASLAACGVLAKPTLLSANPARPRPFRHTSDMRESLKPRRVTNAMWDFSWLTQHYPGGAFEDFSKAADQLVERGFNTVRIDAFPLVIGALKSERETITLPADPLANWGMSDRDRDHSIVAELIDFMRAMKRSGLYVILSSWGKQSKQHSDLHQALARDRSSFRNSWARTLDILGSRDLLDHVLYVDLDQEFPYFSPYANELSSLAGNAPPSGSLEAAMQAAAELKPPGDRLAWNPAQMRFVQALFTEMLGDMQARYPGLRFTYSLTSFLKEVRAMNLRIFDVLEVHCWIHSARFENRTGFNKLAKDRGQHDYSDYGRRLAETIDSVGPMLAREMHNQIAFAKDWSEEIGAPVITTEAWGPWWHMDHKDLDWGWLKSWCEQSMDMAAKASFWGVTPWNYSHPYWNNWSDVKWYRKVNKKFLNS